MLVPGPGGQLGFNIGTSLSNGNNYCHIVTQVDKGGPAMAAGLAINDIILKLNGELTSVMSHDELVQRLKLASGSESKPGFFSYLQTGGAVDLEIHRRK